ncbi:YdcF family protein [Neisseriaceae bacterium TC5R-5]|nr:YdcF family protein [Neisseriaceae bacterium TC5R-5]
MNITIRKRLKRLLQISLLLSLMLLLASFYANWHISQQTKGFIYNSTADIPAQKAALILGTVKNIGDYPNPYFNYRIAAAKKLYESGKVRALVVSGDNGRDSYNEPEDMRQALIASGIPESAIYMDYAGFRTLDSVVRMHKIFGQQSFIIVSQNFHNERAIFLAQHYGLQAYGYNAEDVQVQLSLIRRMVRENFARLKVWLDILTNKQPRFLGNPIPIA